MVSRFICIGIIQSGPKRAYSKKNYEVSHFSLRVKREDGKNNYDIFNFEGWDRTAKFINDYLNTGDVVSVISIPRNYSYTRKNGTKVETVKYLVSSISFICKNNQLKLDRFEGNEVEEILDINDYGNI